MARGRATRREVRSPHVVTGTAPRGKLAHVAVRPQTKYAQLNCDHIAYQVIGDGHLNLVLSLGFGGNVDAWWDEPSASHFFERLASFSRLILYDRRGRSDIGFEDRGARPLKGIPGEWHLYGVIG
jgi:hypothetical protein